LLEPVDELPEGEPIQVSLLRNPACRRVFSVSEGPHRVKVEGRASEYR
jgi:hypothetical protein